MEEEDTPEFKAMKEARQARKKNRWRSWANSEGFNSSPREFQKVFLFVYGTLMDSNQLEQILGRSPHLQDAETIGYKIVMWGPYPALMKETNQAVLPIYGKAFEIETAEELELLKSYETRMYRCTGCQIQLRGAENKILGKTFLWAGPEDSLEEGSFDLTAWQEKYSR